MNIINAGSRYQVYGEDVKTYHALPNGTYDIRFHPMEGFSLVARNDLVIIEDKIYGNIPSKIQKVMKSYNLVNRNFGVLLSGPKGIGKSLFVRLLAQEAIKRNLPIITVNTPVEGVANFISSIQQDCIVIFDEFEKIFHNTDDHNPQDELLSLFDGTDGGHKLFIVTCNDLGNINEYMLNRPGRFHYHFTMMPPTPDEVKEYMTDKLLPEYYNTIEDIVQLSSIVDMPYDYLRAIAFEVNQGYPLKEALSDLNITRTDNMTFDITVYLTNGLVFESWNNSIDMNDKHEYERLHARRYDKDIYPNEISFYVLPSQMKIDNHSFIIDEKGIIQPHWDSYEFYGSSEENEKAAEEWNKAVRIEKVILKKNYSSGVTRLLA